MGVREFSALSRENGRGRMDWLPGNNPKICNTFFYELGNFQTFPIFFSIMCCSSWWFTTPLWVWIGGDVPYRGHHQWCPHPTPTGGWYTSNLNDTLWKKTKETFVNSLIPIKKGSQLFVILWTLMSWCRCKLAGTRHFFGYHRRSHVSRQTCAGGFWFSFSYLSFTLIFYLKIVSS